MHEVWPGHYLQFQHSLRNPSIVAGMWVGYAYAEGWAHYAEEMMWDVGAGYGAPDYHVGQLTNALLRNVRFLSAIGLHTQGMTVEQSEKMFREKAFADAGTARQQAARGTYDPAYLNYTLGKLMIRKLRRGLDGEESARRGRRPELTAAVAGVPRQVPVVRRPADSAGSPRDDGRRTTPARCSRDAAPLLGLRRPRLRRALLLARLRRLGRACSRGQRVLLFDGRAHLLAGSRRPTAARPVRSCCT